MTLDEAIINRLSFIKYLYNIAVEQSQSPEPLCYASILTFHDSIELFLCLSAEYLNVYKKPEHFMDYWNSLKKERSIELTQKVSMERLNKARVDLKHHGIRPSKLDVEGFRASATNFFEENTPVIFDINFSDVSLIEMVQCEKARDNLKEADEMLKEGRIEDSLDKVALSFVLLIDDYENRKKDRYRRSPFFFGESMVFLEKWAAERGLKAGEFHGPPYDVNEILRTKRKVEREQKQLPRNYPTILFIENNNLFFRIRDVRKAISELEEEVYEYPHLLAVIVAGGNLGPEEDVIIMKDEHVFIKKTRTDLLVEEYIILFNQFCELKISPSTITKLYSSFRSY